jgi:DeoR/GlpR family transcriptional regulator of sugar metabolism
LDKKQKKSGKKMHNDILVPTLKKERHAFILKQVNLHNRVLSTDLCLLLGVSEDTIRRDLNELAEAGKIEKVHGGALSVSFSGAYHQEQIYAVEKKKIIAEKACSLIKDNMLVLVGGGTSIREMVRLLPLGLSATFCTISLTIAEELLRHQSLDVIMLGGKISHSSKVVTDGDVFFKLAELQFDLCLMGSNGIDVEKGLTENDLEIIPLKRAMIKASRQTAVLAISEKLNTCQRGAVCPLSQIDYLITELDPQDKLLCNYVSDGRTIL